MKTNKLVHTITRFVGNQKTVITISLDDDHKNGAADFSLTSWVTEKDGRGRWVDAGGGCNHDHILTIEPDLALFAKLHLCDQFGAPMHATANAFYWFAGCFADGLGVEYHGGSGRDGKTPEKCREIFADMLRAFPAQVEELITRAPRSAEELSYHLEAMGFRELWAEEARAAIAWLERVTGNTFENTATRPHWVLLSEEARKRIEERITSGYYLPENIAARDLAKKEEAKKKAREYAIKEHAAKLRKLNAELALDLLSIESAHPARKNIILYSHGGGTVSANWSDLEPLWDEAGWAVFVEAAKQVPELSTFAFEFKAKPKKY